MACGWAADGAHRGRGHATRAAHAGLPPLERCNRVPGGRSDDSSRTQPQKLHRQVRQRISGDRRPQGLRQIDGTRSDPPAVLAVICGRGYGYRRPDGAQVMGWEGAVLLGWFAGSSSRTRTGRRRNGAPGTSAPSPSLRRRRPGMPRCRPGRRGTVAIGRQSPCPAAPDAAPGRSAGSAPRCRDAQ